MITIYGIPNCDTMRKARNWLNAHGISHAFHDYKKRGIEEERLRTWVADLGWEQLINRRGSTWRKLPDEVRENIDKERAIRVMLATPSIIRRPVIDTGVTRLVGFTEDRYRELLG